MSLVGVPIDAGHGGLLLWIDGGRFCYVLSYAVLSTTAVLDGECKGRVANDRRKWALIVFIV